MSSGNRTETEYSVAHRGSVKLGTCVQSEDVGVELMVEQLLEKKLGEQNGV